jgi:succinoglycan biosynthesis transport protein ExoP
MAHEPTRRDRPTGGRNGNGGYGSGSGQGSYNGWPNGAQNASEQIRDILHVIFKRKRLIAIVFLAITLPGLVATLARKPSYIATAKVMISTQRDDPTLQPTNLDRLETIQLNESLVNSEVHVIKSRDLLDNVVRSLAISGNFTEPLPVLLKSATPFGQQVIGMGTNLIITPIKASNVIQIDYKASDPSYAARVVNRVVDEYLAYHAEVHGAKGLPRFYDEQQRLLETRLRKAEESLAAFSMEQGIASPKDEILATVRATGEMGSALRELNTSITGTEERIRAIREQIASQPEVVKRSQFLEVNPVITQLSTQLVDRQVDRVALLQKYTEKDRHVRDNGDEIAALKAEIEAEVRDRPTVIAHQLYRTNPIREERLRMLLDLDSQLKEMRARQVMVEEDLSRSNRRLVTLQQKSIEYDRLDQEVKNSRDTYELYVKREQEARISQAMDEQKLVNVNVVQRPALPLPRSDTQRTSVAILILAGLVLGLAAAFGREYMSRSLRSEHDVGRHLGLPLLASIGDVPRS